jgi:hypothetical protein
MAVPMPDLPLERERPWATLCLDVGHSARATEVGVHAGTSGRSAIPAAKMTALTTTGAVALCAISPR